MRIFVAIEVSDKDVLNSIHKIQTELNIKAKPVELYNMHFTVQFLGEVSEEMVGKISDALNNIEFSAFSISFASIGVFPNLNSPRVIWIGTDDGFNELEKLAEMIRSKLSDIGFSPDKKFKPHVTIFRVKNKIEDLPSKLEKFSSYSFGKQLVSEIKLKKSELTNQGSIYTDLLVVKGKQ
uniref:RNA 2',3'-cyclic phosphodiesterase n=3 Tax=environmental samples TaxID=651140 RepID=A0A075HU55_9ARCH|nr:2'-5' RNA ligase (ligT) [uncultured marine thaumarchaeote KM3_168_H11]AIF16730.1 2'-5' RNA ligase (ligT) [uncultured marine thaumarchaeote KM3_74_G09]AIF17378.1 2'-5' RNA ligase (ligT) [uncultured marine thaumarchaeote KM3_77_D12]